MTDILAAIGLISIFVVLLLAWPISGCLFDLIQAHRKGRP